MGRSLFALLIYSIMAVAYYQWQFEGYEPAKLVFMFWVWLVGIVGTIALFDPNRHKHHDIKSNARLAIGVVGSAMVVVATVHAGEVIAAGLYVVAVSGLYGARLEAKKKLEGR